MRSYGSVKVVVLHYRGFQDGMMLFYFTVNLIVPVFLMISWFLILQQVKIERMTQCRGSIKGLIKYIYHISLGKFLESGRQLTFLMRTPIEFVEYSTQKPLELHN